MSFRSLIQRKGARVTFTHVTPGTYDPATDTTTPGSVAEAPGYAAKVRGVPATYERLQLIESENPTLEFLPDTPGVVPDVGWTVEFGGETLTAKDVDTLAMNGISDAAFVVVSR